MLSDSRMSTPLLGICLGIQLLFGESEEFGATAGLGLIPGRVVNIPSITTKGESQKILHIGWDELVFPDRTRTGHGKLTC